ncbi:MAG TPA: transcriptional repressor [Opitutae bacterium]|nr:transcriptional repressor [Opitutae bacterium]|tara:strand:+ start:1898 stop:2293 length:396 start_codon:yes stop_codon:yes gene_type:complete
MSKSLRATRQRHAIKKAFEQTGRPLGPKEVLDLASQEVPNLGIATVYRNIKTMLEQEELETIDLPGQPSRYFPKQDKTSRNRSTPLFLCQKTNRVYFVDPSEIELQIARLPSNFVVDHSEVILYGECTSNN